MFDVSRLKTAIQGVQCKRLEVIFFVFHILVHSSIQEILDQNVTEGNNLTLTCNVPVIPPPLVSWVTPDGQRFDRNVLKFLNISRSQAGAYRREASDDRGNATEVASIDVQCKQ